MEHQEEPLSFIVKPDDGSRMLHAPKSVLDKAEKMIIDISEDTKVVVDSTSCKQLLSARKVQQYLHDKKDLIIINSSSPISTALKTLIENNVHSAPVYDEGSKAYLGFIDLLDVVSWLICNFSQLGENKLFGADLFESLKEEEKWFTTPVKDMIDKSGRNPFKPVDKDASLLDVAKIMGASIHSIPIVNVQSNSFLGIITQSQIIQILCEHIDQLGNVANQTLEEINLSAHVVLFAKKSDTALEAFKSLHEWKVHGLPIVADAESQVLVGNLSASDMRILIRDKFNFSCLYLPVHELIKRIRKEFTVFLKEGELLTNGCSSESTALSAGLIAITMSYIKK